MEPQVSVMTNCMVIGFSALVANRQNSYKKPSQESLKRLTFFFFFFLTRWNKPQHFQRGEIPLVWNTRWVVKGIAKVCLFKQTCSVLL